MTRALLVALVCGITSSAWAQTPETSYIIRNVNVIATSGPPVPRVHDVVIRGRRVAQVAPAGTARVPNATVIDGRGKYLIPGLIDSHVHIKQEDPLFLFIVNGVTTVQNMAGVPLHLRLREESNAGKLLAPRIVTAGATTAQAGVRTVEEATRLVREQKAAGYNLIKMYGSPGGGGMEPEVYRAVLRTAREKGLRVGGHAPRNQPFQLVLDERQSSIDHMEEIVYTHAPFARVLKPHVDLQFGRASAQVRDSLLRTPIPNFATRLRPEIRELARAVKAAGVAITPNLVFFRNIGWSQDDSIHALLRAPELAYAAPAQRLGWTPMLNRYRSAWRTNNAHMGQYFGAIVQLQNAITKAFHAAGVPLMTGTDSEGLGAQPGFGLHTELELFVQAGMTPMEALRAATIVPARVMQIADSVGSVTAGKIADVVLLDANPLDNIANTRRIAGVFRAGRWVSAAHSRAMLDSLARSYAPAQAALGSFMTALETQGAAAAMQVYRASPVRATIAKTVENVINSYGYRVMGEGRIKDAIQVFLLNTDAFPGEYNTWDSLAESYMNNGQKDLAIKYYRKVLELRPGDENATRQLNALGVKP